MKPYNLRIRLAICASSLFATLWLQAPAMAHLGGNADSVGTDRERLHAQLRSIPMQQYQLHEMTTASGTVVHEYESRQGIVFAVTWQGPLPPDLRQLFGNYYDRFQSASSGPPQPGTHRQLSLTADDLVVQSSGHVRAFRGRAYVPSLVPAGVSVADLQ